MIINLKINNFWIASFLAMTHFACLTRHCEERSNPEKELNLIFMNINSIISILFPHTFPISKIRHFLQKFSPHTPNLHVRCAFEWFLA